MKKIERIVYIVLLIIAIIMIYFIIVRDIFKNTIMENEIEKDGNDSFKISETDEIKDIKIYDIEEGYMMVPENKDATKNNYNWENLIKSNGIYQYEDTKYYSKIGIDVSSHQKTIDWKKVKDAGVDFTILRLGYRGYGTGKIVIDSKFEENYKNAIKEGIEIGVYFFSQAVNLDEVKEEAEFVINNLKNKSLTYPVVFDLEKIKNDTARTDNLTIEEITDMAIEFCNVIKKSGYEPSVYGNAKTFTKKMHLEKLNSLQKWYADYQEKPIYPYDFSMWQYTETGKINGVKGNVDINIQFIEKK